MKKYRLFPAICLVAALLLSACSQDEPTENSTALPEGEYPLLIGSVSLTAEVSEQPWTRVAESTDGMSSEFKAGDAIGVSLNGETATYTYDGNTWTSEAPLYWKDKQPATVTAWYPVDEEIDFTQQDVKGLTYLLKANGVEASFDKPANLTFSHQLAKVRVKLKGDKAGEVRQVYVRSYPKTTNTQGEPGANEGTPDYYPMRKAIYDGENYWEANLLDGYLKADDTFRVSKDGNSFVQVTLDADVPITVGQIHTITINVEQAPTEIDLDTYEAPTLKVSGKTILRGDGTTSKNLQVTVAPDTELTLQNVNLSYNEGPTIICQGTAHITLSGNNQLSPTSKGADDYYRDLGSGIEVRSSGTLTIESEPNATLTITRRRTDTAIFLLYGAGIGLYENANLVIKGGTITVTGGSRTAEGGANIGGFVSQNAGTITLEGGTFTLQDQCMLSSLIGAGTYGTCGTVTIRAGVTINGTTYAEDHVGAIQE